MWPSAFQRLPLLYRPNPPVVEELVNCHSSSSSSSSSKSRQEKEKDIPTYITNHDNNVDFAMYDMNHHARLLAFDISALMRARAALAACRETIMLDYDLNIQRAINFERRKENCRMHT